MFLEFSSIKIENFKSFIGPPTVFPLTHKVPGLRFIKGRNEDEPDLGPNGAAKSSIFAALSWCLFGQTVDGLRTPDILPWNSEDPPCVAVTVFKDKNKHTIVRATKPNQLLLDGGETGQAEVEQFLGFNFDVFKHTMLFGQNEDLFLDLSPKDKMDVLSAALDFNRWETRSEKASDKAKELAGELIKIENDIAAAEAVLKENDYQLTVAKSRVEEWEAERRDHAKEYKATIADLNIKLEKLAKARGKADLELDSAETEARALRKEIEELTNAKAQAQANYNEAQFAINGLISVVKALKEEITNSKKAKTCPTCGQSLKGTNLAHHKEELETRIEELQAKIDVGVPKKLRDALDASATALDKARKHAQSFLDRADEAQSTLNRIIPDIVRLETQIRTLSERHKELDNESNPYREQVTELRKSISKLETKLNDLDKDVDDIKREQVRTQFWVKGFKSVRLFLLEEILQELELATNALLPESGLRDWEVRYSMEKETKKGTTVQGLNLVVLSPNNTKPVKWESWSGGERHRLRLVGALALAEVLLNHAGVNTNLEVLDEPTHDLSVEGVQDLCEFLANRAETLDKDIFITGHNVIESAHFADTITVVKKKGAISYIEK